MHSSFIKSKVFTVLALVLLTYFFTFPMLMFHGTLTSIHNETFNANDTSADEIWNFYNQGRYKSVSTPRDAHDNLEQMIESGSEIGVASTPLWFVSLEAPNYPKIAFPQGIPVYFHFDGFSGEVHEMNTINHYIGMDPMWVGGSLEREVALYALLFLSLVFIYFIAYNHKIISRLMLIPVVLPFLFVADYTYWLYWFGHNLHDWGAFDIKPFMPTVFGQGKVAQFSTHSYPHIGYFLMMAMSAILVVVVMIRKKQILNKGD